MRDGDFELVTLRSGARAVRHCGHGEVMHPAGGPWVEANRLYVEQSQLAARLTESPSRPVCIFDIGLGAATNAVAALTCAQQLGGSIDLHRPKPQLRWLSVRRINQSAISSFSALCRASYR